MPARPAGVSLETDVIDQEDTMDGRIFRYGGYVAGALLLIFGIGAFWVGWTGYGTVQDSLKAEGIQGSPDMTPALIAKEAKAANLPATTPIPSCSVAGKNITTGDTARCFAQYMRIHTLEATGGQTYAQMGRYLTAAGTATNDQNAAAKDAKGQPVANGARDLWVTETALTTALNTSYMAERLSIFGMVVGVAFILSGVGFVILDAGVLSRGRKAKEVTAVAEDTPPASATLAGV
jgi:hypothetical protein